MDEPVTPAAAPASAPGVTPPAVQPVVLVILDGFGCRDDAPDNAITRAAAPHWRDLLATCPHTMLDASERRVGLPEGQAGNSEVGHLNIGAGRVVYQYYTRIDMAIRECELERNPALSSAIAAAARNGKTLHVMGLLSPGGVHSHERHVAAMVEMAVRGGAPNVAVHAFLDGRDTPPKSAAASIEAMERICSASPKAHIASICGRYYAMDRD
ncbi:MAG: 2,3-bisphosphoglycerate-independent phosphoglycerate mutase, partial [Casimicrobiaceae bacterium]